MTAFISVELHFVATVTKVFQLTDFRYKSGAIVYFIDRLFGPNDARNQALQDLRSRFAPELLNQSHALTNFRLRAENPASSHFPSLPRQVQRINVRGVG